MSKRLLSSALLIMLIISSVFYFPNWLFSLTITFFIGFALYEFYLLVGNKEILVYKYFGVIVGLLVPLVTHFTIGMATHNIGPFLIVIACLLTFVLQFTRREKNDALIGISVTLLGILYISWFFSFIIKIKFLPQGSLLVAFLLLVTKGGDIGAYIVGSTIGKHVLIPRISPKKTIEGLIGALVFSFFLALISKTYLGFVHFGHLVVLGLLLGVLGQVGDLSESLIKRDCGVKDTGRYFPGLGGSMDVLDSLLFTTPIFYFYIKIFLL